MYKLATGIDIGDFDSFRKETNMSNIIGLMLQHDDGDKEYYEPQLTAQDQDTIFKILEKYGDDNDSMRGDLEVIELNALGIRRKRNEQTMET